MITVILTSYVLIIGILNLFGCGHYVSPYWIVSHSANWVAHHFECSMYPKLNVSQKSELLHHQFDCGPLTLLLALLPVQVALQTCLSTQSVELIPWSTFTRWISDGSLVHKLWPLNSSLRGMWVYNSYPRVYTRLHGLSNSRVITYPLGCWSSMLWWGFYTMRAYCYWLLRWLVSLLAFISSRL